MRLRYDLKRVFSGRAMVLLLILTPVVVMLVFSAVLLPMLAVSKGFHFNIAICNEDKSETVREFVNQMVNSYMLRDMITNYPVPNTEVGIGLLRRGDVSLVIHVAEGLYEKIENSETAVITIISTQAHALEVSLVEMAMDSSLSIVSQSQHIYQAARNAVVSKNVDVREADAYLDNALDDAIARYTQRRGVVGEKGVTSSLGEYLPVEYYLGAVFSLFAALGMLPLIRLSAADASGAVLRRGYLLGGGSARFFFVRTVSGAALIVLVLSMLFPTMLALNNGGGILGRFFGNAFALIAAILLCSLCFSAMAAMLGAWFKSEQPALWAGFYTVLIMAVVCGALIPEGALSPAVAAVGRWLPLRAVMRSLSAGLFRFEAQSFLVDALKLSGFTALFSALGVLGFHKRGRGA